MPAPIAAAIGSSSNNTLLAPADETASRIALRSTRVDLQGTQTTTLGCAIKRLAFTLVIKCLSIFCVTSKSAITPSFNGRIAVMLRSEEHTSELQSREKLVCRLLLEKKNTTCRSQCTSSDGDGTTTLMSGTGWR